ncbi:Cupin domain-containing protein [Roseivirga pacifica]|uniref:Cupin domain-containing protein n=1 Tax=Roseivirga pacifica TaxID=1267423 RepID=A0A1I0NEZ3_9BACT|nr:cupin domain-containing protein [Roseivirga pacifica]RKQ51126.1 Cupin domain-containing protein [Roseivirga pacifica]SEV99576.1 Cupin domain-containing protein [Roseivirga pacifica]
MPFVELSALEQRELIPGFKGRFIHTEKITIAYWNIAAGSILPEHSHQHEQVAAQVISGEFEMTLEGETKLLKAGDVAVIPSNVVHSGEAITDCQLMDVFAPVREDYK